MFADLCVDVFADVKIPDAASNNDAAMVRILVDNGADVNAQVRLMSLPQRSVMVCLCVVCGMFFSMILLLWLIWCCSCA